MEPNICPRVRCLIFKQLPSVFLDEPSFHLTYLHYLFFLLFPLPTPPSFLKQVMETKDTIHNHPVVMMNQLIHHLTKHVKSHLVRQINAMKLQF